MPTKKTVTTVEEGATEPEVIEVDEVEEAAESALDGLLAEFSGADDVTVNVYRQGEGKNLSFLFKTMPEDMTGGDIMERCRDQFGTGDYRMHVREGRRLVANRSFSVEAPVKPTAPQPTQFGTPELMALMTKQNENMQAMFANTMTAIATMFSGASQNQPAVNPVEMQNSIIQGIQTMKQLAEPSEQGPGPVEMLVKGLELAREIAPKTGETNTNDIFLKALEAFPALAQMGHRNPPVGMEGHQPVHALKGPPKPAPTSGPQDKPDPQATPENEAKMIKEKEQEDFIAQARANLQWLCRLASQNKDPELYAEVVLDQMGREAVLEFIGHDTALEQLAVIEPSVKLYPGWFHMLKDAILELTREGDDEPDKGGDVVAAEPEVVPLTPEVVLERIDRSGLRREGQQGAPVTIPSGDASPDTQWNGSDSESPSDT